MYEERNQSSGDGMLGRERRTAHLLTFSLLLWDHRRRLWERLANLAISSRISSYRGEKGREERGTDFSAGKQGAFTPNHHTKLEVGFPPAFWLCEGPISCSLTCGRSTMVILQEVLRGPEHPRSLQLHHQ